MKKSIAIVAAIATGTLCLAIMPSVIVIPFLMAVASILERRKI